MGMVERLVSIHHDWTEDGIELEYEWLSGGVHLPLGLRVGQWATMEPKQPPVQGKTPSIAHVQLQKL